MYLKENGTGSIQVDVTPSEAILKLAISRHRQGLMSPFILQALLQVSSSISYSIMRAVWSTRLEIT